MSVSMMMRVMREYDDQGDKDEDDEGGDEVSSRRVTMVNGDDEDVGEYDESGEDEDDDEADEDEDEMRVEIGVSSRRI